MHPNVLTYWADGASLAQLMQSGEVYMSWAWNETYFTMSYEGHPIAMKRDTDEGSSSWFCGLVHSATAEGSTDKFYDFLNAWMEDYVATYIVEWWGYGHSNVVSAGVSSELLEAAGLDSSPDLDAKTLFQGPVNSELRERIAEFELIRPASSQSGDRPRHSAGFAGQGRKRSAAASGRFLPSRAGQSGR